MKDLGDIERYEFKKKLEEIKSCKGQHTELISLYIPPNRQISDVMSYLRNEYSQSTNIKSKTTRKNVLSAIESIMSRLRYFKKPPENGLVFFVGNTIRGANETEMVAYVIEPPVPIQSFIYRCDSSFYTQPLEDLLAERDVYGLFLIDRRECTIGMLRGKRIELIDYLTSRVPGKHGRGGQSQRRFERLIELAAHEWFEKCGKKISEIFLNEKDLKGIFVGGPGPTKYHFVDGDYLHYEVKKKIIDIFDTGYTDESGLRELVEIISQRKDELKISKEKRVMRRFLKEIVKREKSLAVYGEEEVRRALEMGAVDTLLLSEDLDRYRVKLRCESCGREEEVTTGRAEIEEMEKKGRRCRACDGIMVIKEKIDVIEELSKKALEMGTKVELISKDSEEGATLLNTFGGIAGILRYNL
ncbi:MAG TPA: peptide chain release factor 1 [Thermoplasmatales archaeon]|nr:peptide chain release factor 1 [Thermoplasmatales archaeon]HEX17629.1 peptide chain release factor 1 [Thermoplasmatales archaeon]